MTEFNPVLLALIGTGFTFAVTTAGAAMVFFMRKDQNPRTQRVFLGFAAGVLIAASVWSLIIPAIEMAEENHIISWIPAGGGFLLGGLFLLALDKLMPQLYATLTRKSEGFTSSVKRTAMLIFAITLHNIPEGMAVGLAFGLAGIDQSPATLAGAMALAAGIGLQNFPEGAAVSLPLKKEGFSKLKSFSFGAMSGIVEPIAGMFGVLLATTVVGIMPWMLSFAAGAMIFVVAKELIPEAHTEEQSSAGTVGVLAGFLIMMILDVALG